MIVTVHFLLALEPVFLMVTLYCVKVLLPLFQVFSRFTVAFSFTEPEDTPSLAFPDAAGLGVGVGLGFAEGFGAAVGFGVGVAFGAVLEAFFL